MSDVRFRGYDDLVARLCAALRVRHVAVDAPSAALELLGVLRAEHYALLGVVDGKRPTDDYSSEPTADSTKRQTVDPFGGGVRIGEASNPGPTPMQTPAAAKSRPLAQSPTPPTPKRAASPPDARGSPTSPAPPKRALNNRPPTALSPASLAVPAALPTPLTRRPARTPSPTLFSGAWIAQKPGARLVRPVAIQAGVPTPPAAKKTHALRIATHPPRRVHPSPVAPPLPPRPPPPLEAFAATGDAALVAQLRADDSKHALRPADPHFLTSMAAAVSGGVDAGFPVWFLYRDNRRWAE